MIHKLRLRALRRRNHGADAEAQPVVLAINIGTGNDCEYPCQQGRDLERVLGIENPCQWLQLPSVDSPQGLRHDYCEYIVCVDCDFTGGDFEIDFCILSDS